MIVYFLGGKKAGGIRKRRVCDTLTRNIFGGAKVRGKRGFSFSVSFLAKSAHFASLFGFGYVFPPLFGKRSWDIF